MSFLIIVRESYSYNFVKKLGVDNKKIILLPTPIIFRIKRRKRKYVGIFIDKNLEYFLKKQKKNSMDFYSKIIKYFLKKHEKIILLPQVIGINRVPLPLKDVSDYSIIKKLAAEFDPSQVIVPPIKDIKDLLENISKCKFCIVSRFHSLLFVLKARIPFICISYTKKTEYLLKDIKLKRFCISLSKYE